ncbi:hypothetical protein HID58_069006 [Brassica napus]|uniref:E3 ubiquitin ligase UBR4 C-terminal domain-containing protein n=1 Tax=Brassica napus TaxID=3708 RepID=A0ABQ7ZN11_BRANA|nr:hypothetical protein HID58_069006 [Brassica napus]
MSWFGRNQIRVFYLALLASNAAPLSSHDCDMQTSGSWTFGGLGFARLYLLFRPRKNLVISCFCFLWKNWKKIREDPEIEFAIAGTVGEYGGLGVCEIDFKSNEEEVVAVLDLLNHCCKIRESRRAALSLLVETARRASSVDAMEPAEGMESFDS